MHDLTTGSITRHLLRSMGFMLVMMLVQTLYFLVDLYWVGRLGTAAVAGVGIAGNVTFIVLALMQMLSVGTTAVVSHAVGRRDAAAARHAFNQAIGLSVVLGLLFLVAGTALRGWYARAMSADAETARLADDYLRWFVPAMALQFPMGAMGSALRGTGNFKPGMLVGVGTVLLNMALAPVLIFGWGTGRALGVAGAALSTLVAIVVGTLWYTRWFLPADAYLRFAPADWRPSLAPWRRILGIGLPTGFEFSMMAVYQLLVYGLARDFGAAAQAGFGIGIRIIQSGFMPVVALGFAVAPVAGQNFGARDAGRVRATFRTAAALATGMMLLFLALSLAAPDLLIRAFTTDARVVAMGAEYLRLVSWSYPASGIIFVASSMFQAMGNTVPSLVASAVRMALLAGPILLLAGRPQFDLTWVWYASVVTVYVQLALSVTLLRREMERRLGFREPSADAARSEVVVAG